MCWPDDSALPPGPAVCGSTLKAAVASVPAVMGTPVPLPSAPGTSMKYSAASTDFCDAPGGAAGVQPANSTFTGTGVPLVTCGAEPVSAEGPPHGSYVPGTARNVRMPPTVTGVVPLAPLSFQP